MDATKLSEEVLVIPTATFEAAGVFHGFQPYSEAYQRLLLNPAQLSYRPRALMETDPTFKQLIPYVVLRCGGEVFQYTRGRSGTETRLQARRSIGIGGHICRDDGTHSTDPYRVGMLREVNEEVEIQSSYRESMLGFIYDGRSPVGEVHLGIVHLWELDDPLVWPRETSIADCGFSPVADLLRHRDDLETWSQFALEAIVRLTC